MEHDSALLQRYARSRDAEAFAQLVRRHAAMVFAAARRITGCPHDAEDVTQACFLDLARNAGAIRSSLGGWLHAAATHRACNVVRDSRTRRKYEQRHAAETATSGQPSDAEWEEIAPQVDAALAALEQDLREPLVLHFLQGRTQAEVAEELGISQPTVSRRLEAGVESLRAKLKSAGVVASTTVLTACLAPPAEAGLPPTLAASLGKIAVAGIGSESTAATAVSGGLEMRVIARWVLALVAAAAAVGGVMHFSGKGATVTDSAATTPSHRVVLEGIPTGHRGHPDVVGVERILHYLTPAARQSLPYERLMGLSGMAFIVQAQDDLVWEGMVDVGWWPKDAWSFYHRRDFLSQAIGWQLRHVSEVEDQFRADPAAFYQKHFAPEVQTSIAAGKPLLGWHDMAFVISGYDDIHQPPLGWCACDSRPQLTRPEGDPAYPWGLLVFDHPIPPLNADAADREALRYALALNAGEVTTPSAHHATGQKAYGMWSAFLRDPAKPTQARHHDNMLYCLALHRTAAVAYLREVASGHPGEAAAHLSAAADCYQQLLQVAEPAETAGVESSQEAREQLAKVVDRLAALDAQAAEEVRKALTALEATPAATVAPPAGRVGQ